MQNTFPKSFRSPLGRARGLGSSKSGVSHWWFQRVTAVALIPLTIWFVVWMLPLWFHTGASQLVQAFQRPEIVFPTLLWNVCLFYHGALGLQVIAEDYVPSERSKILAILAIKGLSICCAVAGNLAVLKLYLGH
ncbi:MAG: succinate dehydrogenase, hydrophobic membrane anchor protein [Alphaproteobacteria bacterium]